MTRRAWILAGVATALVVATTGAYARMDAEDARDVRERAAERLLLRVDRNQMCHRDRFGRYASRLTDLAVVGASSGLSSIVHQGIAVTLEASRDGKGYLVRITGSDVDLILERRGRSIAGSAVPGKVAEQLQDRCAPSR